MSIIEKAVKQLQGKSGMPRPGVRDESEVVSVEKSNHNTSSIENVESNIADHTLTPASNSSISNEQENQVDLPFEHLAELGMITPDKPRSQIAEEFRSIKRPLLMNIEGKGAAVVENANLIMVTSALPGEGKTFSAINLAFSIAMEQDKTVLLVDADVSKASAVALLGVSDDHPGLIDLLESKDKRKNQCVADVLVSTNISNLKILPTGRVHEHATELLASENMRMLMKELSTRYSDRVIVFDSPPLLLTNEASVLTTLMGQIMFVVAAEKTSQDAVSEALKQIGGDKIIGMVLNKARQNPMSKHGYGYGYGYGFGYGGSRIKR